MAGLTVALVLLLPFGLSATEAVPLNCRIRHQVVDAEAFAETVWAERQVHVQSSFRRDGIAEALGVSEVPSLDVLVSDPVGVAGVAIPTDLSGFWSQPVMLGPLAEPAEFGYRLHPVHGTVRFHNGLDVRAERGEPVGALAAGVVRIAAYRGGYGETVVIDHGSGFATLYAHLSTRGVVEGQAVVAGAVIGTVGSSGTATGPHLHLETRLGGVPVNPRWFVPLLSGSIEGGSTGRTALHPVMVGGQSARRQIERLYLTAFGRLPDVEEAGYWRAQCQTGVPLEVVAQTLLLDPAVIDDWAEADVSSFLASSESPASQAAAAQAVLDPAVRRVFFVIFGRTPDTSGSYYWMERFEAGESLVELAQAMGASPEYQERFSLSGDQVVDDLAFLNRLYVVLFDRLPDEDGRSYWLDRIDEIGRWQVLVGFAESPEGRTRLG